MDFLNNNNNSENEENIEFSPIYNPINYTDVEPVDNYKPANKGLKIFALVMAFIMVLTLGSLAGYFTGKNSIKISGNSNNAKLNLAATPTDTDEMTAGQVYEKVNPSIVGITVYNSEGENAGASGIIYSKDGYIITNDHIYSEVVSPKFRIHTFDGKEYSAEYVAGDSVSDLAVLKVKGNDFKPATFGNSDETFHGQNVVAIGRPGDATAYSSITNGIISSTSRRLTTTSKYSARLIETNCAINPGSSGGALVNMYGQVIGVTSSKMVSTAYDNVGYAIPTTIMKRIVEELISKGRVESRAKLGITYLAVDSVTAEINGYEYEGMYVDSVAEDSDLFGKVQKGDVITHINGQKITDDDIVLNILESLSAGDKISVTLISDGKTKTIDAVLKSNPSTSSYKTQADQGDNDDENSGNGGKFDFPQGE